MKALYLPKLMSGDWSGTMNLTEPQAGSDVGALRTKAEPNGDGTLRDHGAEDLHLVGRQRLSRRTSCHLVLARLPDAVPGTKGISLFHGAESSFPMRMEIWAKAQQPAGGVAGAQDGLARLADGGDGIRRRDRLDGRRAWAAAWQRCSR